MSARRALAGFVGPRDVFRNPLAIYRKNEPCPAGRSPFDLELGVGGDAFAIHAMHFKLGLYEHQSAGALQSLVDLFAAHPGLAADLDAIRGITVRIYEPAFSIIADPAKRTPTTSPTCAPAAASIRPPAPSRPTPSATTCTSPCPASIGAASSS